MITSSSKLAVCFLLSFISLAQAGINTTGDVEPINPIAWNPSTTSLIGHTSQGTLTVNSGSIVTMESFLGYNFNTVGTAHLLSNSSNWNSQNFYVGFQGNGELNITNGGHVYSEHTYLGYYTNSVGTTNISGNDSAWENSYDLIIGNFGNGQLNVINGGLASSNQCQVGVDSNAVGIVTVSGDNSTLISYGSLQIGGEGRGELYITENGFVRVADTLTIDCNENGNSFVNMDAGGMLALWGEADNSLNEFLGLVEGTDAIRWWNASTSDWAPLTTATAGTNYTLEYLTDGVLSGYTLLTVKSTSALLPGDVNGDGKVDGSDITILANHWQIQSGATRDMGDLNGDGKVDGSDVTIIANHWQTGVNNSAAAAVPEPNTLLLLLFGLLALGLARLFK